MDDRRDRVEEGQRVFVGQLRGSPSARAGEVRGPVATMTLSQSAGGRPSIFVTVDLDQRMGFKRFGDRIGKRIAIHGQRAAGRHLIGIGAAHDQRPEPAQLRV